MSLNSTYHKNISAITVLLMFWNIAGWLGFGLLINQVHSHAGSNHCDIVLCSCEVESEGDVCNCHHNDYGNDIEQENNAHGEFCFYTSTHSNSDSSSQILIPIEQLKAFDPGETVKWSPPFFKDYKVICNHQTLLGFNSDLLRPPQV